MHKRFLQQTAEYVKHTFDNYQSLIIVFPTRRACGIFKKSFAALHTVPVWLPQCFSIEDFYTHFSHQVVADDTQQLLMLHECFCALQPPLAFSEFYDWGKVILRDFEDVDEYLVDADKLFATLNSIADIDEAFDWDEEQKQFIRNFWESLLGNNFDEEAEGVRTHFLNNWKYLRALHTAFYERLSVDNMTTLARMKRTLANRAAEGFFEGRKIMFAGMFALTKAEELLLTTLMHSGNGFAVWDFDKYYAANNVQEAGQVIRERKYMQQTENFVGDYFTSSPKHITVTGATNAYGQTQYVANLLASEFHLWSGTSAIVLPDESLLPVVLQSLPSNITSVNITMGYSLQNSFVAQIIDSLQQVLTHRNMDTQNIAVSRTAILQFSSIVQLQSLINIGELRAQLMGVRLGYVSFASIESHFNKELFVLLQSSANTAATFVNINVQVLQLLLQHAQFNNFEHALLSYTCQHVVQWSTGLQPWFTQLTNDDVAALLSNWIDALRVPFESEQHDALQLTGFLETRTMDFDNVIILSMNEGHMPPTGALRTYIPYSLRKAFRLPTDDHSNAINAYHFYRLMQRTSQLQLVYNTEISKTGGGEPSRFLLQLKLEMVKNLPNIHLREQTLEVMPLMHQSSLKEVAKTPEIIDKLRARFTTEKRGFSATAFTTYLTCNLRFYYAYVQELREPQTDGTEMEAREFGDLLHKTLAALYKEEVTYTSQALAQLKLQVPQTITTIIKEHYAGTLHGYDLVNREIIEWLVCGIIDNDMKRAPIHVSGVERSFTVKIKYNETEEANITGSIDRMETTADGVVVIDFKTGAVKMKPDDYESFDKLGKVAFQLLLYAWALHEHKVMPAVYPLKSLYRGLQYLYTQKTTPEKDMASFEKELKSLVSNILDPNIPFMPVEDKSVCVKCPYQSVCLMQ